MARRAMLGAMSLSRMLIPLRIITLSAALSLLCAPSRASLVVAPTGNAAVEGDTNNSFPFDLSAGATTMRYQQVYDAALFSTFGGPQLITRIAFRPDAGFGSAFSSTLPNIRIDLSTTAASSSSLSTIFANNVG